MARVSMIVMFLTMSIIGGPCFGVGNNSMIWLGALFATGLHFIPFCFVHGKLLIPLAVALMINAMLGILDGSTAFWIVATLDGALKILFGILFFHCSNP